MTPTAIIARLGGAAALARALRLPPNDVGAKRVRAWALRNSIPSEYWVGIAAHSKEQGLGVTLEVLASAHAALAGEPA
ncbi:carph-isopro domain-containing protein [Brevundimonas diminuta]